MFIGKFFCIFLPNTAIALIYRNKNQLDVKKDERISFIIAKIKNIKDKILKNKCDKNCPKPL